MKYLSSLFLVIVTFLYQNTFADNNRYSSDELKNSMIPENSSSVVNTSATWEDLVDFILAFIRDSIFWLLALIAIGMFIYIGAKLIMARGNQEEFTKALKSLAYAAVGIILVSFAWVIVRLIAGIQL